MDKICIIFAGGITLPINRRQKVYPNGTLVIEHTQRENDAGTYTCQAQNRQKHNARRDVEVMVLGNLFSDRICVCICVRNYILIFCSLTSLSL